MVSTSAFEKTGDIKVGPQIFEIVSIIPSEPEPSYILRTTDYLHKILRGSFVQSLLVSINPQDIHVEEVINNKTKKNIQLKKEAMSHRPITRSRAD